MKYHSIKRKGQIRKKTQMSTYRSCRIFQLKNWDLASIIPLFNDDRVSKTNGVFVQEVFSSSSLTLKNLCINNDGPLPILENKKLFRKNKSIPFPNVKYFHTYKEELTNVWL